MSGGNTRMIVFSPTGDNIGLLSLSSGISVNDSSSYMSRMMKLRRRDGIKYVNGSISLRNKSAVSNFRDSISVLVDFRDCGIDWYVTMNLTFC